jgi:hypothetical protein
LTRDLTDFTSLFQRQKRTQPVMAGKIETNGPATADWRAMDVPPARIPFMIVSSRSMHPLLFKSSGQNLKDISSSQQPPHPLSDAVCLKQWRQSMPRPRQIRTSVQHLSESELTINASFHSLHFAAAHELANRMLANQSLSLIVRRREIPREKGR